MSSSDRNVQVGNVPTAEDIVLAALRILQRGLPPGDLSDREVVTELWGLFDNPGSRLVTNRVTAKSPVR